MQFWKFELLVCYFKLTLFKVRPRDLKLFLHKSIPTKWLWRDKFYQKSCDKVSKEIQLLYRRKKRQSPGITGNRKPGNESRRILPYSSRISQDLQRRINSRSRAVPACNCIQCARAWNMGKRYTASITASPTMKVLYFRAVTRNLAATRGLRRSLPVEWVRVQTTRISYFMCVYHPPTVYPVSSTMGRHWLERYLASSYISSRFNEILFLSSLQLPNAKRRKIIGASNFVIQTISKNNNNNLSLKWL